MGRTGWVSGALARSKQERARTVKHRQRWVEHVLVPLVEIYQVRQNGFVRVSPGARDSAPPPTRLTGRV